MTKSLAQNGGRPGIATAAPHCDLGPPVEPVQSPMGVFRHGPHSADPCRPAAVRWRRLLRLSLGLLRRRALWWRVGPDRADRRPVPGVRRRRLLALLTRRHFL